MNIHFDIKQSNGFYYLGIPDDRKAEQKEIQQIKAEWPRPYPPIGLYYEQESLDKAKEGWTKTGKIYHLLSKDDKGYPVTHEYPEYFDGENKFIVVKEYNVFHIRKVTPVTWYHDRGFLCFESSDSLHLVNDFIDLPINLGTPIFDEKTLKEYFNQFFATEMIVDQRYEKEPPVLITELANRNYDLRQENATIKQENEELKTEKSKLEKEIEELKEKLQKMEQEALDKKNKRKQFQEAVENTGVLVLKKLEETEKTL